MRTTGEPGASTKNAGQDSCLDARPLTRGLFDNRIDNAGGFDAGASTRLYATSHGIPALHDMQNRHTRRYRAVWNISEQTAALS